MAVEWQNGIPILTDQSLIGDVPEYTQTLSALMAGVMPIGLIQPYVGTDVTPLQPYWLLCNGAAIPAGDRYDELRNLIGSNWGGKLPNLQGRALIGAGTGSGLTARTVGQQNIGKERHAITEAEMPSHRHSINGIRSDISGLHFHPHHGVVAAGQENYAASGYTIADPINYTGGNQTHENMQPSAVVNFIILAAIK